MAIEQVLFERYHQRQSLVHALEPRAKLLATLAFAGTATALPVASAQPRAWLGYVGLALLAALAVAIARAPLGLTLRRSAIALPFAGMVALSLPFTRGGVVLWSGNLLGLHWAITVEGLWLLGSVLVKAWLSVLVAGLLVMTTPMPRLLHAFQALRLPAVLVMTISLMYRYLFVLAEEAGRLHTAREARSVGKGGTVWWRARVLGGMVGSLFIRSYGRSERVYDAMLARGFDGELRCLDQHAWLGRDTLALAVWLVALVALVVAARITGS